MNLRELEAPSKASTAGSLSGPASTEKNSLCLKLCAFCCGCCSCCPGGCFPSCCCPPGDRSSPAVESFILIPWLCVVIVTLWTLLLYNSGFVWVIFPVVLILGGVALLAHMKIQKNEERKLEGKADDLNNATRPELSMFVLCFANTCIAGIVVLITYFCFLQSYASLGGGATYLNVLPSQSALGASDATAIVFATGTQVDTRRSYGFSDVRNGGGMYCVAPVANKWTELESTVQFFAAGQDCCGTQGSFGCSKAGSSARGAMMIATEYTAAQGYKSAVEGAAAAHGIVAGRGYLLLEMVADPMELRHNMWSNALKLLLIYVLVDLILLFPFGCLAFKWGQGQDIA